jgi:ferredoxin--NADP+ reductase
VEIDASMVLRSVGYRGLAIPGVPFDPSSGTIPNDAGRPSPGEYVTGWIKRGPSGVIGTNRSDAAETVRTLFADVDSGALPVAADRDRDVLELLDGREVTVVPWDGWLAIDQAEVRLGERHGRPRVKIHEREQLLSAALR